MSNFDSVASEFERHRLFPEAISNEIREAVCSQLSSQNGLVLDLGAGTGRIGRSFVKAGKGYVGVDKSFAMLSHFQAGAQGISQSNPILVQADGDRLPFRDSVFKAVFIAHVLNASHPWHDLLDEARRVLDSGGVLIVGQRVRPEGGIDAQLREQLKLILSDMNIEMSARGKVKSDARAWLAEVSASHQHVLAASWKSDNSPRRFLERHPTGAWFSSLDSEAQQKSLNRLTDWSIAKFGSLDNSVVEEYRFELDLFRF